MTGRTAHLIGARRGLEERARLAADLVLGVRRAEHREHQPIDADRRLDHVGHVLLLALVVVVLHRLAALLGVLGEVVAAARRQAHQLLRAEGELEDDVGARARVVRQLVVLVDLALHQRRVEPDVEQPLLERRIHCSWKSLPDVVVRRDEVLDLHLLELARAEDEVARRDLVAERLADLRDPERHLRRRPRAQKVFAPNCAPNCANCAPNCARPALRAELRAADGGTLTRARRDDVLEVGEDALRRLGAEVRDRRRVGERADVRLEHQVEVARRRERAGLAGGGRRDQTLLFVGRLGEVLELGRSAPCFFACSGALLAPNCACAESRARLLLHFVRHRQRLRLHLAALEHGDVAERLAVDVRARPEELVGAVASFDSLQSTIGSEKPSTWPDACHTAGAAMIDESRPTTSSRRCTMSRHHAFLMFARSSAERAVVEEAGEAAVHLRGLEDEAAPLAHVHDLVHRRPAVDRRVGRRLHVCGSRRGDAQRRRHARTAARGAPSATRPTDNTPLSLASMVKAHKRRCICQRDAGRRRHQRDGSRAQLAGRSSRPLMVSIASAAPDTL